MNNPFNLLMLIINDPYLYRWQSQPVSKFGKQEIIEWLPKQNLEKYKHMRTFMRTNIYGKFFKRARITHIQGTL